MCKHRNGLEANRGGIQDSRRALRPGIYLFGQTWLGNTGDWRSTILQQLRGTSTLRGRGQSRSMEQICVSNSALSIVLFLFPISNIIKERLRFLFHPRLKPAI